jgi:acyl carrier protein
MSNPELECKVIEIVAKQLGVAKDKVTRSSLIQDDLGADSLDIVELVMELEDGLDIQIPDEALEKIKTVGDVMDYAEKAPKKA